MITLLGMPSMRPIPTIRSVVSPLLTAVSPARGTMTYVAPWITFAAIVGISILSYITVRHIPKTGTESIEHQYEQADADGDHMNALLTLFHNYHIRQNEFMTPGAAWLSVDAVIGLNRYRYDGTVFSLDFVDVTNFHIVEHDPVTDAVIGQSTDTYHFDD